MILCYCLQCCFGLRVLFIFFLFFFFKFKAGFYVYFKNKCKVVNVSVYSIAAVFPEITGIAQHIFLHVQVYKVAMRTCDA